MEYVDVTREEVALLLLHHLRSDGFPRTHASFRRELKSKWGLDLRSIPPGIKSLHEILTEYTMLKERELHRAAFLQKNALAKAMQATLDRHAGLPAQTSEPAGGMMEEGALARQAHGPGLDTNRLGLDSGDAGRARIGAESEAPLGCRAPQLEFCAAAEPEQAPRHASGRPPERRRRVTPRKRQRGAHAAAEAAIAELEEVARGSQLSLATLLADERLQVRVGATLADHLNGAGSGTLVSPPLHPGPGQTPPRQSHTPERDGTEARPGRSKIPPSDLLTGLPSPLLRGSAATLPDGWGAGETSRLAFPAHLLGDGGGVSLLGPLFGQTSRDGLTAFQRWEDHQATAAPLGDGLGLARVSEAREQPAGARERAPEPNFAPLSFASRAPDDVALNAWPLITPGSTSGTLARQPEGSAAADARGGTEAADRRAGGPGPPAQQLLPGRPAWSGDVALAGGIKLPSLVGVPGVAALIEDCIGY